jgi:hypothetical protein
MEVAVARSGHTDREDGKPHPRHDASASEPDTEPLFGEATDRGERTAAGASGGRGVERLRSFGPRR